MQILLDLASLLDVLQKNALLLRRFRGPCILTNVTVDLAAKRLLGFRGEMFRPEPGFVAIGDNR